GDGNIYGHMDQATKIECRTCHGVPTARGSLTDADGNTLNNVEVSADGNVVLTSKVSGAPHVIPQVMDVVNADSPRYNAKAAAAMNGHHLKTVGGMECYACHASWAPNCFGCHFERDERFTGLNLITRREEMGVARTGNKVFVSLKHFAMGLNAQGKYSPYIVGCQPIADVTAADGSKKLDFVMPETTNGLSGLALQPVDPHTIRGRGEVRTCVECHRSPPSLGLGSGNYSLATDRAYTVAADGIHVFDRKSDPTNPAPLPTLTATTPQAVAALPNVVSGNADYLYVATGPAGLSIFDMTGGLPDSATSVVANVDAVDVSRAARYLYVVAAGTGVNIYDNGNPAEATLVSTVAIPTAVRAVSWGIHLFVAAGQEGLVVVDISDHSAPRIIGTVPGINAVAIRLYAHHQNGPAFAARAYVADPDFGVRIVDLLPEFSTPNLVGGLALVGAKGLDTYTRYLEATADTPSREHDYLYAVAGAAGLRVYDITDPDAIVQVAALTDLGGDAVDIDVASQMAPPGVNDYALVANAALGLQVIDVTDPLNPGLLATVGPGGASRVLIDVQQLDRFVDEQGNQLKENSHPGAGTLSRADIVRILSADLGG
ncbi:MAG: hypothetical protein ACE5EX_11235, partial [Phycisphaerae bacterium]